MAGRRLPSLCPRLPQARPDPARSGAARGAAMAAMNTETKERSRSFLFDVALALGAAMLLAVATSLVEIGIVAAIAASAP